MPSEGVDLQPHENLLTSQEIQHLARLFVQSVFVFCFRSQRPANRRLFQQGITKIRLTGGEPTIRKDFISIVERLNGLREFGLQKIGVTTNGIALHRKLGALKSAGMDQINLSLDTLDPLKFELMTRRLGHDKVLASLYGAIDAGFETVKLNVVVIKGVNDMEVLDFVELTRELPISVRFIEYMPFDGNRWNMEKFIPYKNLLDSIRTKYPAVAKIQDDPNDTTKSYKACNSYRGQFGFITSMSEHFCGTCNRLRLLADGNLKVCLFGNTEVNLRDVLRGRGVFKNQLVGEDPSSMIDEDLIALIDAAGIHYDIFCLDLNPFPSSSETEKETACRHEGIVSNAQPSNDFNWWIGKGRCRCNRGCLPRRWRRCGGFRICQGLPPNKKRLYLNKYYDYALFLFFHFLSLFRS